MPPQELLDEIWKTKLVYDASGKSYNLRSSVDQKESSFLQQLIKENNLKNTIEIGCAYGISSLSICDALSGQTDCHHTIIDAFQKTHWNNIGRLNLEKTGIDFYEIIEELSEIALPQLLASRKKYDFGFIDGWHTFDHTLLDFFYLNRMLDVGGIIVIDDVGMPGINKCLRYILNYPAYEVIGSVNMQFSKDRELFDSFARRPLSGISKLFPAKLRNKIFSGMVVNSDKSLHLNSSMIAIRKIKEDERSWSWFQEF